MAEQECRQCRIVAVEYCRRPRFKIRHYEHNKTVFYSNTELHRHVFFRGSFWLILFQSLVQVLPLFNLHVRHFLLALLLEHVLNLLCCVVWQWCTCPSHSTKMTRVFLFSAWVFDLPVAFLQSFVCRAIYSNSGSSVQRYTWIFVDMILVKCAGTY